MSTTTLTKATPSSAKHLLTTPPPSKARSCSNPPSVSKSLSLYTMLKPKATQLTPPSSRRSSFIQAQSPVSPQSGSGRHINNHRRSISHIGSEYSLGGQRPSSPLPSPTAATPRRSCHDRAGSYGSALCSREEYYNRSSLQPGYAQPTESSRARSKSRSNSGTFERRFELSTPPQSPMRQSGDEKSRGRGRQRSVHIESPTDSMIRITAGGANSNMLHISLESRLRLEVCMASPNKIQITTAPSPVLYAPETPASRSPFFTPPSSPLTSPVKAQLEATSVQIPGLEIPQAVELSAETHLPIPICIVRRPTVDLNAIQTVEDAAEPEEKKTIEFKLPEPLLPEEQEYLTILTQFAKQQKISRFFVANHPSEQSYLERLAIKCAARAAELKATGEQLATVERLAKLAMYKHIVLCDNSSSMRSAQKSQGLKDIILRIGTIATSLNDEREFGSIGLYFLGNPSEEGMHYIRSCGGVEAVLHNVPFDGKLSLGSALQKKILNPYVIDALEGRREGGFARPLLITIITDGEISNQRREELKEVVSRCKEYLKKGEYGQSTVAFHIALVAGRDYAKLQEDKELAAYVQMTNADSSCVLQMHDTYGDPANTSNAIESEHSWVRDLLRAIDH